MRTIQELVREFHLVMGCPIREKPTANIPDEEAALRSALIAEEFDELCEAQIGKDVVGVADALADLIYVVYGTAAVYGIDLDACVREVHRSNMTKLPRCTGNTAGDDGYCEDLCSASGHRAPLVRRDGKIQKPASYRPPDLEKVLNA